MIWGFFQIFCFPQVWFFFFFSVVGLRCRILKCFFFFFFSSGKVGKSGFFLLIKTEGRSTRGGFLVGIIPGESSPLGFVR